MMRRQLAWVTSLALAAAPLAAQTVGNLPEQSPFTDIRDGQRLGVTVGYLWAGTDPVSVGPKPAALLGLRYDWHAGGPAYLTGRLFQVSSQRDVLDFTKKVLFRRVGTVPERLLGGDFGLSMALTGDRAWHQLQPIIHTGVGFVAGMGDNADVSGYHFAPTFDLSFGFGARYVTGRNSQLRADFGFYLWQVKYPETYRSTQGDPQAIRPTGTLSPWTLNRAISVSWTWGIFR